MGGGKAVAQGISATAFDDALETWKDPSGYRCGESPIP
jgi:hypothetical protein